MQPALLFEWDPDKARRNLVRHRVSFEEAREVFRDPHAIITFDPDHSWDEDRYFFIGMTSRSRLLAVACTYRGDRVRLISARLASGIERRSHEGP